MPRNDLHGMSFTKVHRAWTSMLTRVRNKKNARYENYGGRGISVCDRWKVFKNFLADMGEPPTIEHSLDRIDNNGNYEPGNCRWATKTEQRRNLQATRRITVKGVTKSAADWAEETGVSLHSLHQRLDAGWPESKILSPTDRNRKKNRIETSDYRPRSRA